MAARQSPYESWLNAQTVCVLGAGTMGSGIAAHLANLGFRVSLLDVTKEAAEAGLNRAKLAKPSPFYLPEKSAEIRLGGISENFDLVRDSEWVCEAVVEKLDVKRELFARIDPILRPETMISTNTSGLQIELLSQGRSESFRKRFLGTHFFNPPRYLKLLELIPTPDADPRAVQAFATFLEERVARRVVLAKDTPGFIANRYGMWSMFHAIHCAEKLHLTIEQVDTITGPFLGRPKSGSFRLNDIVGLDIMEDIAANLIARCQDDPHKAALKTPASMKTLLERGWIGGKAGQGYYKKEGKDLFSFDLGTLAYRNRIEPDLTSVATLSKLPLGERVRQALLLKDEVGEFLRSYLVPTLQYADYLKEEVSHSVRDFDRVMMWGFGWEAGPFEMIDAIGAESVGLEGKTSFKEASQLGFDGRYKKFKPEPQYAKLSEQPVISSGKAHVLRDLGDGVTAFCLTTKAGSITPTAVAELTGLLESGTLQRFVLTSDAKFYSVGFDLNFFAQAIPNGDFGSIDRELYNLQRLGSLIEQVPSVAAIWGYALGAGFELALSCSHIAADAECQIGLPESRVGLLPGGRGTALMRIYNQGSTKRLAEVAMTLTEGTASNNAEQARQLGYLRASDVTVFHPDRLIAQAKELALAAKPVSMPIWTAPDGPLGGMVDRLQQEAHSKGEATDYDLIIGDKIKGVFAKSEHYQDALLRERSGFVELCGRAPTLARIKHMLETGKPLRN